MPSGIVSSVGEVWSEGRKFTLRHLKDFGMGKSKMEDIIQHEAVTLAKSYEGTVDKPVEISWNLNVAVLNVIWKLVANQRYETDDEEVIRFSKMVSGDIELIQGPATLLDIFPGLHKVLPAFIQNHWMKIDLLHRNTLEFKDFLLNIIKKHEETHDPKNHRDYIDAVLTEMQNNRGNPGALYAEDYVNLITSVSDLFAAGSETTSSTTRWIVALLANYPDIQRKMQKEIDSVVPKERPPSLQDRDKLPYTEAVLLEAQRFASLLPLGVMHATTETIKIEDYVLPEGTVLFGCTEICHRDPKYWERPNEFYPEHFLDGQGKLLTKKEGFLPFSLGRRQCLGESLAKMELFLFATCLFQKFFFAPPKDVSIALQSIGKMPLFNFVPSYKVVMTLRN
ncbi:hypothetical protein SK128_006050 [Halocaridina rubra]|uniref:Cytochrome P450 n=1 Tax=Halocaridina rubra TaxID=373956 RepID=A0AAN8XFZ1_HALRR